MSEKKLILYGSGLLGKNWIEYLGEDRVYAFADSDTQKQGKKVHNRSGMIFRIDEKEKL